MSSPEPHDQQAYWDDNLDPQNIGQGSRATLSYRQELLFHLSPDQRYAIQQFQPLHKKLILEIGAGLGVNAMHLAGEGASIVAIDIAQERLRAVAERAAGISQQDGRQRAIYLVKAKAEELPFRDNTFHHAYSKAVLIHTQLETAVPEIERVVHPGSVSVFLEPLQHNPLVNLYRRTLAPRIWQSIARYFGEAEFSIFHHTFQRVEARNFYLLSFLAFGWQFALPSVPLYRACLAPLHTVDGLLMKLPPLARRAWFVALVCRKR